MAGKRRLYSGHLPASSRLAAFTAKRNTRCQAVKNGGKAGAGKQCKHSGSAACGLYCVIHCNAICVNQTGQSLTVWKESRHGVLG